MKHTVIILVLFSFLTGCGGIRCFFDLTPPQVVSFEFEDTVTVKFSKIMYRPKTEDAFGIEDGNGAIEGAFTWQDKLLIFGPYIPFQAGASYVLTVDTGAEDIHGNSLSEPYTACPDRPSDTTPPKVTEHSPGRGAVVDDPRQPVSIIFSEPLIPGSLPGSLRVSPSLSYSVTWNTGFDQVVLLPLEDLQEGTEYQISLKDTCTDEAFNPLTPEFDFYFTQKKDSLPELLSVKALVSGCVLQDVDTVTRNSGIRHDDRFELTFSQAIPAEDMDSRVSFGPGTAVSIGPGGSAFSIILSPEEPLSFNSEYTLEGPDRIYNLYCSAAESAPPEVGNIYISIDGEVPYSMELENSITGSAGTADFFLFISSPAGISLAGLLESFDTDITNACIDLDIISVTVGPVLPAGLREPAENEIVCKFSGPINEHPGPGILTITLGTGLTSSTGVPMTDEAVFQVTNL